MPIQLNAKTLDDLKAHLESNLKSGQSGVDAINQLGQSYVEYAKENTLLWRALFEFPHPEDYLLPSWYSEKVRNAFELLLKL